MLRASIARKTFLERLNMSLYLGLAMAALGFVALGAFSDLDDETADLFDDLPDAFEAMIGGSAGGNYVVSEVFGLVMPVVLLAVAISAGVSAVAGEERRRTAELLLSLPVTRRSLVTSKAVVMVLHVLLTTALFFAGFQVAVALFDEDLELANTLGTAVHMVALALAFGMIALMLSAATGSTLVATTVSTFGAVAANLGAALPPLVSGLKDAARVSPWYYYNGSGPLENGIDLAHLLVLLGIGALAFAAAIVAVSLRDIRSGAAGLPFSIELVERVTRPQVGSIFTKSLSGHLFVAVAVALALLAMTVGIAFMFEGLEETLSDLSEDLPSGFEGLIGEIDLGTPTGWIHAEVLSVTAPLAVIGVGVYAGSGAVAGEEGSGTLGLLFSMPVRRTRVVIEKGLAMVTLIVMVAAVCGVGVWVSGFAPGMDGIEPGNTAGAMAHLALLGILFGMVALALGSAFSSQVAVAGTIALAVVSYLVAAFFPLNDALDPATPVSPWFYYSDALPLANGAHFAQLGALAGLSAVAFGLAMWLVDRREVSG